MNSYFFDSHFHLDLLININEKIKNALSKNILCGIVAGISNEQFKKLFSNNTFSDNENNFIFQSNKKKININNNSFTCFLSQGLHPESIYKSWINSEGKPNQKKITADKEYFEYLLSQYSEYIWAIGETGFDLSKETLNFAHLFKINKEEIINIQEIAFDFCVEKALQKKLPLIIHSVNSWQMTKKKLLEAKAKGIQNIMIHCYSGPTEELPNLAKLGIYCSFGGVVTWKNTKKIKNSFLKCSKEFCLIETDSPDLPPILLNGQKPETNEPAFLHDIAIQLASYLSEDLDIFSKRINQNFLNFLMNNKIIQ
jgi:Tat protein secretion system quality control protein TatD with DNase activity